MFNKPLFMMPRDIQRNYRASVESVKANELGAWHLVAAFPTSEAGGDSGRVIVVALDADGSPVFGLPVVFAWDTAVFLEFPDNFSWAPPYPQKGIMEITRGGEVECIQGGFIKPGQEGGITAYIADPEVPSDIVRGAGIVPPGHTGLWLVFRYFPTNELSLGERVSELEAQLEIIKGFIG
jgi:hypothetical protein